MLVVWTWVNGCDAGHYRRLLFGAQEVRVQCSLCGHGARVARLSNPVDSCMVRKKCMSSAHCVDVGQRLRGRALP